jgi:hypothetical protein
MPNVVGEPYILPLSYELHPFFWITLSELLYPGIAAGMVRLRAGPPYSNKGNEQ